MKKMGMHQKSLNYSKASITENAKYSIGTFLVQTIFRLLLANVMFHSNRPGLLHAYAELIYIFKLSEQAFG